MACLLVLPIDAQPGRTCAGGCTPSTRDLLLPPANLPISEGKAKRVIDRRTL
jgi:hypothetical protein